MIDLREEDFALLRLFPAPPLEFALPHSSPKPQCWEDALPCGEVGEDPRNELRDSFCLDLFAAAIFGCARSTPVWKSPNGGGTNLRDDSVLADREPARLVLLHAACFYQGAPRRSSDRGRIRQTWNMVRRPRAIRLRGAGFCCSRQASAPLRFAHHHVGTQPLLLGRHPGCDRPAEACRATGRF